jgi:hypothetical protein
LNESTLENIRGVKRTVVHIRKCFQLPSLLENLGSYTSTDAIENIANIGNEEGKINLPMHLRQVCKCSEGTRNQKHK